MWINKSTRIRLAKRHDWRCWWCNQITIPTIGFQNTATIEHVIPRGYGGTNEFWNLVSACHRCNDVRGTLLAEEFAELAAKYPKDTRTIKKAKRHRKLQKRLQAKESRKLSCATIKPSIWKKFISFFRRSGLFS